MPNISQKVIAYIGDNKDVIRKVKQIEEVNRKMALTLGKDFGRVTKVLGEKIQTFSKQRILGKGQIQQIAKYSQAVQLADGRMGNLITTTTTLNGKVRGSKAVFREASKQSQSLGANIARLAKRALLTIPIWLALRTAIMGTFRVIRDGIKTIAEQDRAFQKARRNLSATAQDATELAQNMTMLREETLRLSLQSGKSIEELTHAFQRFATVGFDAEASMAGMQYATKLAVVEFGDATQTANAFARAMRVLIDTSEGARSEAEQIAEAMALTDQLWQTNAFEIQEFTQNLLKFAGTAKAMNISTKETITLLATLSTAGLGTRAGRLLRTTILKALQNLDKVAQSLNLNIDPAVDSTFNVVIKLVGALQELSATQNVPAELADVLGELFTVRTTEVLSALRALETTLKANAQVVPDIAKLDKTFEEITKTTGVLTQRITNLNKEIGKAFVIGLTGSEDFNDSLQKLIDLQKELLDDAQLLGVTFNAVGKSIGATFSTLRVIVGFASLGTTEAIIEMVKLSQSIDKAKRELKEFEPESQIFAKNLKKALSGKAGVEIIDRVISGIETRLKTATIDPEFDRTTLQKALEALQKIKQEIIETTEEQERQVESQQKIIKSKPVIIQHILEELKLSGAVNSVLLKTESVLNKRAGIEEKYEDTLERQLEIEREINAEKRLQTRLSSDAIRLFEIAQEQGSDVAKRISEVLAGEVAFDTFVRRGGEAVDVFKDKFADIFKEQQALAFFKGERVPGLAGLRGGVGITLPNIDQALLKTTTELLRSAEKQTFQVQYRLELEEKITALRQKELARTEQVLADYRARVAERPPIPTRRAFFEAPTPGTIINRDLRPVSTRPTLSFQSGAIQLNISADTPTALKMKTNEIIEMVDEAIQNKLVGKQTPVL
ncbi:MAG: phage tail tape measure protein [Candidatus Thorarchaeota archaeon]|jgi:hypothetical protein